VVQQSVAFGNTEAARREWFLQGTEQASFAMDLRANGAGYTGARGQITSPKSGTIIALDPDIPAQRQRLQLQARGSQLHWLIDGKRYANGPSAQWLPWPGRHVIQIANAKGQVQDEVHLEVRGAGVNNAGLARRTSRQEKP
jgi:penicillin-binding protein 1C